MKEEIEKLEQEYIRIENSPKHCTKNYEERQFKLERIKKEILELKLEVANSIIRDSHKIDSKGTLHTVNLTHEYSTEQDEYVTTELNRLKNYKVSVAGHKNLRIYEVQTKDKNEHTLAEAINKKYKLSKNISPTDVYSVEFLGYSDTE